MSEVEANLWNEINNCEIELRDTTQMEDMLQMVDPEHSYIIDDNIGLIGEFATKEREEQVRTLNKHATCYEDGHKVVGKFVNRGRDGIRGDYFKVVDSDGCIIIDEYIKECGVLYGNKGPDGYIFILKDYVSEQPFDSFFDDENESPAVVIYIGGNLYINEIKDSKLQSKYIYDKSIKIEEIRPEEYMLSFGKGIYQSYRVDINNHVGIYKRKNLQL